MQQYKVQVAIIGAGSAGMAAYEQCRRHTDNLLLIEAERYGTTCARVGCMPSKLLIASALRAQSINAAEPFGLRVSECKVDGQAVLQRVRRERDRFVGHVIDTVSSWPEKTRIMASARFVDDHTLQLSDGSTVQAEHIIVATGSEPRIPAEFETLQSTLGSRFCTSDDVFDWPDLPRSVAVFGGGVIGLELGLALHHLGVRVVIFGQDDEVAQLTDPEVLNVARALLTEAYAFLPDAEVDDRQSVDGGVRIRWQQAGKQHDEVFEKLLVATGRMARLQALALDNTSLALNDDGVPNCDPGTGRCGDSSIYLVGDAGSGPPLLHLASSQGKAAGLSTSQSGQQAEPVPQPLIAVTFTEPQIMTVGQSHAELRNSGQDFAIGQIDWTEQGRARVMGTNQGLLRLYAARESGRLLGAEMIGPAAEHLAHLLCWCMQSHLTVADCLARPFYHPCVEEGLRTALRSLHDAMHGGSQALSTPHNIDCGPGG